MTRTQKLSTFRASSSKLLAASALLTALPACGAVAEDGAGWQPTNDEVIDTSGHALSGSALINGGVTSGALIGGTGVINPEPQFACGAFVTTNADSGPGSLREAVANPPNWGSVCFSGTSFGPEQPQTRRTILVRSPIELPKDVHVAGPGGNTVIVSGGYRSGIFAVRNVKATLYGFSVVDSEGSAIANNGNLTLDRMLIARNHATGSGGALYNSGTLRIARSTLEDNISGFNGGAIYAYYGTSITIERSTFRNNGAADSGGALCKIDGDVAITHSTFVGNYAAKGGAIYHRSDRLTLTQSSFETNDADYGGAIYQYDYGVTSTELRDTNLRGNWANVSGGGAYNTSGASFKMYGSSEVAYNGAASRGGVAGGLLTNVVAGGNVHSNTPTDL